MNAFQDWIGSDEQKRKFIWSVLYGINFETFREVNKLTVTMWFGRNQLTFMIGGCGSPEEYLDKALEFFKSHGWEG